MKALEKEHLKLELTSTIIETNEDDDITKAKEEAQQIIDIYEKRVMEEELIPCIHNIIESYSIMKNISLENRIDLTEGIEFARSVFEDHDIRFENLNRFEQSEYIIKKALQNKEYKDPMERKYYYMGIGIGIEKHQKNLEKQKRLKK